MKKVILSFCIATLLIFSGCEKYLDVNQNPNNPAVVEASLILAPIQTYFAQGYQFDGRYIGRYNQNFFFYLSGDTWDFQSYVRNSDAGGQLWRDVYWHGGVNLSNLLADAKATEKWDYYGVGLLMRAWGWQMLTDIHGEIVISEAFIQDKNSFKYDTQEFAYKEVERLCLEAITNLQRTDGNVSTASLGRGDLIYKGDRNKWIKFAYALLAINAHHLSNKALYNPDKVIEYVDKAMATSADDAYAPYAGNTTVDGNVIGPLRGNWQSYGQSTFIVNLMNGTNSSFAGVTDPRMPIILAPSGDGIFRGLNLGAGQSTAATVPVNTRVPNLLGTTLTSTAVQFPVGTTGKYIYTDKAGFPLLTLAEMQFIKSEAAFKKGDFQLALSAYTKAVSESVDFANRNLNSSTILPISTAQKTAFLANPIIIPATSSGLTLSKILLQKYIALHGWGFIESWTDLRRYKYDPSVFTGFILPLSYPADNLNKPVQRLRPRYNSEYVWNIEALKEIGALEIDYHTKPMWFTEP